MPQQKLWLVRTGFLSSIQREFLVIGFNMFNARLNAENYLMQQGDTHWAYAVVTPANVEDTTRILGESIHPYIMISS